MLLITLALINLNIGEFPKIQLIFLFQKSKKEIQNIFGFSKELCRLFLLYKANQNLFCQHFFNLKTVLNLIKLQSQ